MPTIDLDSSIELKDGNHYQFVSQSGGLVRLKCLSDGEYYDMHIATLSENVVGLPVTFSPDIRTFENLPDERREDAMNMSNHIEEILTGINPALANPRAEYDLEKTTQNERIAAKVSELNAQGAPASRATLSRKIKAFREHGPSALADHRAIRRDPPLKNLDPFILDALTDVIAKSKDPSTGTKSKIIHDTQALLLKRHKGAAPALPSMASMYRYIEILTKNLHTTGSAKTRQSLGNRPKGPYRKRTEVLPGGEVQVDSTTLDILVRSPSGNPVRPILTVMFDRATRLILAFTLRLVAAKGVDHVTMLAQALTPPQNRPDNSEFRAAVQRNNPQVSLLSREEREEVERTRPHVHPRVIVMDNGKDFVSDVFLSALHQHGCDIRFSAPHTPTGKPLVERNFGSLNTLLLQYKPGYVGRSPEFRGYKVDEQNLMDIYALHEVLDDWFLKHWNHRPHKGLRDPMNPEIVRTPYMAYTAASRLTTNLETTLTRDDYIALLPTAHRKVRDEGVVINNRFYDAEGLNPLRHTRSANARRKGKHVVKLDPYNPFYAWVENPEGGWIECAARDIDASLYPHLEDRDFDVDTEIDEDEQDRAGVAATFAAQAGAPIHDLVANNDEKPSTTITDDDDADLFGVLN